MRLVCALFAVISGLAPAAAEAEKSQDLHDTHGEKRTTSNTHASGSLDQIRNTSARQGRKCHRRESVRLLFVCSLFGAGCGHTLRTRGWSKSWRPWQPSFGLNDDT